MKRARKLVLDGSHWRLSEASAPPAMSLEGLGVLGWPGSSEGGLCVVAGDGQPAVGWGELTDRPVIVPEHLLPIPHTACAACALLLPAAAISDALDLVGDQKEAAVINGGLLGELAHRILTARGIQVRTGDDLDLVIDVSGEVAGWQEVMAHLRPEGSFLALLPPDLKPSRFDFYPQLHRRSLRVVARRWHDPVETSLLDELHELTSVLENSLTRLEVEGAAPSGWWWFQWPKP